MNLRKTGIIFGSALALIFVLYSLFWFWMADTIRQEVQAFMQEAREKDITITTRAFGITGYPLQHEVSFSGRVSMDNIVLEIPELFIASIFLPGKPITIKAPSGMSMLEPADTNIWSLDRLKIESVIPPQLPAALTREDLTAWRQADGQILLENIELEKGPLFIQGKGAFFLDSALQPAGTLNADLTGHLAFLVWLQEGDYVETREAMLAMAVLSGLSRTNEDGKSHMNVDLNLQNRTLFVGPLRLVELPRIEWGWRNQPVLLQ